MKGYWFILGTDITDEEAQQKYGKLANTTDRSWPIAALALQFGRSLLRVKSRPQASSSPTSASER